MPRKLSDGRWLVDLRPDGSQGKRIRKKFLTRGEAARFKAWCLTQATQGKDWNPRNTDPRRLSELIDIWYQGHGKFLADHVRRHRVLVAMCDAMGDPVGALMTPATFTNYRAAKDAQAKTLNNHLGYINAVMNYLVEQKRIQYPNPFSSISKIDHQEQEMAWLETEQIKELLSVLEKHTRNKHTLMLARIGLATGCRWSEGEGLTRPRVKHQAVTFVNTKGKRSRTVPITQELQSEIYAHWNQHGPFTSSYHSFTRAIENLSFTLPAGQAAHVLRHTFAAHFLMNGGDLPGLQKILGHQHISTTMRYAHFAKDHLDKARSLNPLAQIVGH